MTLDEFMSTLQRKSDYDGNTHVVATGDIPKELRTSIRQRGSDGHGRATEASTEYFLALMGHFPSWWIGDDEELLFEMDGQARVWPS